MDKLSLSPLEVCDEHVKKGMSKANNCIISMIISGMLAGAFIALGAFAASVVSHSIENFGLAKLAAGAIFPVGLMFVLICGGELFTGNCLMVITLVEKKITLRQMLKNWIVIYIGNFIGAFIIAYLVYSAGIFESNTGKLGGYAVKVAALKGALPFGKAFASGILCNIVVCLSVWGATVAKDTVGKVFMIWFPIMAFVISGFEHCVANMYYFSAGILSAQNTNFINLSHAANKIGYVNIAHAISNLIPVTLGNIVGGSICIGLAYWRIYKYKSEKGQPKRYPI